MYDFELRDGGDGEEGDTAYILVDYDENTKPNLRMRPKRFTTPRRGDIGSNWANLLKQGRESAVATSEQQQKNRQRQGSKHARNDSTGSDYGNLLDDQPASQVVGQHEIMSAEARRRLAHFRRYRMQVDTVRERLRTIQDDTVMCNMDV